MSRWRRFIAWGNRPATWAEYMLASVIGNLFVAAAVILAFWLAIDPP